MTDKLSTPMKVLIVIIVLVSVVKASQQDEEIIKDLDFFMSMDVIDGEESAVDMYGDDESAELLEQDDEELDNDRP